MFGLIPKEEKFFVMFKSMTHNTIEGALLLKDMLDNFENPVQSQRKIKDIEHKGDSMTHDIISKLNKSFVTPFDREDIYALSAKLDDILDLIDAAAVRIVMYNVDKPTPEAKELGFLILKGCQAIDKAVEMLGGDVEAMSQYWVEVNDIENEADRVSRDAVSRLFDEEKDPIQLIKWKEIYETLERVTDKCEDVANILESIVVKNA
ncbi:MAG: phosphate transport regulator [Bdellovibrionales bacterium RIFOXYC1_FULL_54_43]|nr:MAG: phosphate transport regulator [Bdellovibrionales bacterium RIFOXYC1_FULL_54_43]OFZ81193.1 MAG: phosphate transport regulator [Bdellovibrionales bacterium RIFOXYD1_FULL_55_31]